ncbi:MAG: PAS domain-containing protein [Chloroflexi bacterium]|nr:PAS domain-containing protein [Chloroflexota bacterium]
MMILAPNRSAAVGALVGAAVTVVGALTSGPSSDYLPYAVLPLLAVAVVGLVLGAAAAAWAYAAAAMVLLVIAVVGGDAISPAPADLVRLGTFMLGSPVIVFLVMRTEHIRRRVAQALSTSHASATDLAAERQRSEAARRELDAALAAAERERKRLEEVAEAIPEPLIVYDDQLHGTYGNRAAMRLFGRSFVERALDDWGRVALPRDDHGEPLDRDLWPQVRGQAAPFKSRLTLRAPMSGRDLIVDVEGTPVPGGGTVLLLRDVGKEEDERRRLSRFASFVAHELRNPLAVAKARIELAHRDPKLGKRAEGHVSRALESVDAAIGILERLELYSRADSGRVLRVRDEGPGIADDIAERLFRDRVSAGRGLGLGLYLVHATMSAMGGSVELEQRAPRAVFALRWLTPGAAGQATDGEPQAEEPLAEPAEGAVGA